MSAALGLRDRKKADARRAIALAALELALEHGPDAVTVAAIAAAADVSPRSVFNYFATKDDAIVGHDRGRHAELRAAVEARPHGESPLAALRAVLMEALADDEDLGSRWRQRAELGHKYPSLQPALLATTAHLEAELAQALISRAGADAEAALQARLVASVVLTAVRTAINYAVEIGDGDLVGTAEAALDAVGRGLAPGRTPRPALSAR